MTNNAIGLAWDLEVEVIGILRDCGFWVGLVLKKVGILRDRRICVGMVQN